MDTKNIKVWFKTEDLGQMNLSTSCFVGRLPDMKNPEYFTECVLSVPFDALRKEFSPEDVRAAFKGRGMSAEVIEASVVELFGDE